MDATSYREWPVKASRGATRTQGSGNHAVILTLPLLAILIFLAPQSFAESAEERIDNFELFADCTQMNLVVERLPDIAFDIGLSEEIIQNAAESRLRSARLYRSDLDYIPYLYVNVNMTERAFSISLEYHKILYDDHYAHVSQFATTWDRGFVGTHGRDAGYIVSSLSLLVDRFLVEYLRVNEDACE